MATTNIARGGITIVDMNDSKTLSFGISANRPTTQIADPNNNTYVPDYTSTTLVLTPYLYYSGGSTDQISQCTNISWTINGGSTSGWGTVASSNPCALTINHNLTNVDQLLIVCSAKFVDPDTAAETSLKTSMTISKLKSSGDNLLCIIDYPNGGTFFYNDTVASVTLRANMYVGTTLDDSLVNYQWYKLINGAWTQLTNANKGTLVGITSRQLVVYPDDVLNFEQFKVVVTDNDPNAGTYQNTAEAISQLIIDNSDPYRIEPYSTTGDILTQGAPNTTITANVSRGGVIIPENDSLYTNATFSWQKFNKNGVLDTTFGTNGTYTGRSFSVHRDSIDVKAFFVCTMSI